MANIPKTQRAAVIQQLKKPYTLQTDAPVPQIEDLKPGECLVKVTHSGVCHSDLHVRDGDWVNDTVLPRIAGHEGVGTIVAIGEGTIGSPVEVGDRVGTKWSATICGNCERCRKGDESRCMTNFATSHGFRTDGAFAEYQRSYTNYVTPIPETLSSADAAPILCAGVTVYKALKETQAIVGQWVAISGAGGGLGHLAVQYAVAMGLRVCAIDTGEAKKQLATELGAEAWVDFKTSLNLVEDVTKACDGAGPVAAVISVGNPKPFEQAVEYLGLQGSLIAVGMPGGSAILPVPITMLIAKGLRIIGCTPGNRQDVFESLNLVARGKVKCRYIVKPLAEINEVMDNLIHERIIGRVVVEI